MHTVAIPAYNAASTLDRLLARVCQTLPDSVGEVVVCDNGSEDRTADIVLEWSNRDPRVRFVHEPEPGKPNAWNRLVEESTTDSIVFFDADVVPAPDCLGQLVARIDRAAAEHGDGAGPAAFCGRRHFTASPGGSAWIASLADPVIELCLVGPCYAIRRHRLMERMAAVGLDAMPDVFAEDLVLLACLNPTDVVWMDECVVDVKVDTLRAFLLYRARQQLVRHELTGAQRTLGARLDTHFPAALRPGAQLSAVTAGPYPLRRKLRWVVGAVGKVGLGLLHRRAISDTATQLIGDYDRRGGARLLRALCSDGEPGHIAEPARDVVGAAP